MNRRNQQTVNEEVSYSTDKELVSTTDLRGVITYANPAFCQVAGYSAEELIGKNHNIVRHPDMPAAALPIYGKSLSKANPGAAWLKTAVRMAGITGLTPSLHPFMSNKS